MSTNAVGVAGGVSPEIRAEIDRTNRGFEAAFAAGDVAGAARDVYTSDCRILPPGTEAIVGRSAAEQFWPAAAAQLGVSAVKLETKELHPMGDGAYEIGSAILTLAGGATAVAKYVVIWIREDGRWRWHVDIWNLNA